MIDEHNTLRARVDRGSVTHAIWAVYLDGARRFHAYGDAEYAADVTRGHHAWGHFVAEPVAA